MFRIRTREKANVVTLDIPNRLVIKVLLLVVATMLLLAAVQRVSHTLVLIFTAFFLSLALNSPVHWLAQRIPGKRRGSRTLATSISFLLVIVLLIAFLSSIIPPLVKQTNGFIAAAPSIVRQQESADSGIGKFIRRYNLEGQVQKFSNQLGNRLKNATGAAVSTIGAVGSSIFSVLTVLVLTFMMLVEGPKWLYFFRDVIPDEYHELADKYATGMYKVVKGYVNGQVLLAAIASVLIVPMLFILGINYPMALMVVIFICGLIPLVGHTIGAVIISLVALFTSPWAALIILCYYLLYQQIETYLIQPRIQANTTNLPPLLVFIAVIIGVNFGGILGGLVAIPIMGCLRIVILDYLYSKKIIGTVSGN